MPLHFRSRHFLLGAAGTLSVSCRALGGILGITIFTAIHNNKYAKYLPADVAKAISATSETSGSVFQATLGKVLASLANPSLSPPVALESVRPPLSSATIGAVLGAVSQAESDSYKWVWVAISAIVAGNAVIACFTNPVKDRMNDHIESALEDSITRTKQMGNS